MYPSHKQLLNTGTQETGARRIGRGFDRSFVRSGTRGERNPLFINMAAEKSRFCFYSVPLARIYRGAQPTGKTLPMHRGAFLIEIVLKKIQSKTHIFLAYSEKSMYTLSCCGMIAMKREVAALCGRFYVERMSS